MTLKQLEAFYWAATCLNFTVAAERVHLSISSLSKRIAELEVSLGTLLFDRSGRSAELTPHGELLLPRVRALLHDAAQLQQAIGQSTGLQGRCRIGFGELSGLTWLPKLVQKVAELHPALQLEPHTDIGQVLEQRIVDGELDCVVIAGPSSRSTLAFERVAQVRFVWAASEAFLVKAGTDLPQRLVREQMLIALPEGSGATRILDEWLSGQSMSVERRLSCNSWGAVVGMVAEGLGFTYMPHGWAEALQARGMLRILSAGNALAPLTYTVQWRRDDVRPLITEMRKIIKSVIDFSAPRCLC
ncbi:LysR family transcriptional regulator [Acidovorax sp. SUPP950]|uniref:LysR family transcriptional regulator n=1 Tax=unclassified Acidovorax TaxID=2684926 RepID=UPI0023BC81FF|nr:MULTISPECIES: LysR family transcriptional regulator [Comamonadaceae]WOI44133.1 LysR family transcriptional regulator [Paracidovorax avenae]GKS75325.1 LysR family transcriptional regulator [Acidovorax sp. SUPP950]